MGKYDNVTMKEYMKKKKEMLDDLGGDCMHVDCVKCPLSHNNNKVEELCNDFEKNYPDKALEIVMEYEPKVDWSKVEVDTRVLVRDKEDDNWDKRYFAKYENGIIWAWNDGKTSFTSFNCEMTEWKYAKLYKGDE